jgi:nucleotide-binding universal stress UspA family protein
MRRGGKLQVSHPFKKAESREADRVSSRTIGRPVTSVLVTYEPSPHGRAALFHALGIARQAGVPLTVIGVAAKEPVVGCAQCRQNASFWNCERQSLAEEDLAEAAGFVGPTSGVDYAVAVGRRPAQAIGEAASRARADVIVLPCEPGGPFRRRASQRLAERLSRAGTWEVIVAPGRFAAVSHAEHPSAVVGDASDSGLNPFVA